MNATTGHLSTYPDPNHSVFLCGDPADIAKVSGAVRAVDQDITYEEGRQQAMEQLRQLNKAERNRGRQ